MSARGDWLAITKEVWEQQLVEGEGAEQAPTLIVLREGAMEVLLKASGDPRDLAALAPLAMAGFEGDEVLFVCDTYQTKQTKTPEGRAWERGEMERRRNEPGVLVREALSVLHGQRGGDVDMVVQYYERLGSRIEWQEVEEPQGGENLTGFIPNAIHTALAATGPLVDFAALGEAMGVEKRAVPVHMRMAALAAIRKSAEHLDLTSITAAVAVPKEEWALQIVHNSMRRQGWGEGVLL